MTTSDNKLPVPTLAFAPRAPSKCSAVVVETQVDSKDGTPYAAWSVLRDADGRIRYRRIWTTGQPITKRVLRAIGDRQNSELLPQPGREN